VYRPDQIEVVEAPALTEADVGLTDGDALTRIGDAADLAGKPGYGALPPCSKAFMWR
jgi:hypothetical protein